VSDPVAADRGTDRTASAGGRASATTDVVVVGAGVNGASIAFHLARRGARVAIVERSAVAAGATGRSSGFVRMHYDLLAEAALAHASLPYFQAWADRVGHGDPGFVPVGFIQLVGPAYADALRSNVAAQRSIGIATSVIDADAMRRLHPALLVADDEIGAYEPDSGYADPTGTAAGFLAAARAHGAAYHPGTSVTGVVRSSDGSRVMGVESTAGHIEAPVIVDAAGAWAGRVAALAGVDVPIRTWRHDTAYLGLAATMTPPFPIVIDDANDMYFRPEGRDLMLVGLEDRNEIGGPADRATDDATPDFPEVVADRICRRVPAMRDGTFHSAHAGQDGITPDQRPVLGCAGPEGFVLACGFSGTGFKIAPAIGVSISELILDGRSSSVDIAPFAPERFADGRPLEGEHPYEALWR
jgi:sarcosine oxidase subunit beta